MKSPHCSGELKLKAPEILNAEAYGGYPSCEISIPFNHSDLKHDDWGNPVR